jgi:hypothetical protein
LLCGLKPAADKLIREKIKWDSSAVLIEEEGGKERSNPYMHYETFSNDPTYMPNFSSIRFVLQPGK